MKHFKPIPQFIARWQLTERMKIEWKNNRYIDTAGYYQLATDWKHAEWMNVLDTFK